MGIKILLIEDDLDLAEAVGLYLQSENFNITIMDNAVSSLSFLKVNQVDLVLLDLTLPDYNGLEVCKKIRADSSVPIIVLSANSDIVTRVEALQLGADDYIVKPIDMREVVARIWSVLRRISSIEMDSDNEEKPKNNLILKNDTFILDNNQIILTKTEFTILKYLYEQANITVSRDDIKDQANLNDSKRSLDFHIKNIRKKLNDDPKNPEILVTYYGQGLRLVK